jgi:hypothetical protein
MMRQSTGQIVAQKKKSRTNAFIPGDIVPGFQVRQENGSRLG